MPLNGTRRTRMSRLGGAIKALASIPVYKAKGMRSDVKRGHLLHKQGYGGYRENALSIAKRGKKGFKRF